MHLRRCVPELLLLVVVVARALAQGPEPPGPPQPAAAAAEASKIPSADYLGPKWYTVQVVGTIQDAFRELEKVTGWHFVLTGKGATRERYNEPVALDFTDQPLDVILLGLCEQAGLVYDVPMAARWVQLRVGDLKQDPRPATVAGDYVVRVTDVRLSSQRSFALRWGEAFTGEPDTSESLTLTLAICPRSLARIIHDRCGGARRGGALGPRGGSRDWFCAGTSP